MPGRRPHRQNTGPNTQIVPRPKTRTGRSRPTRAVGASTGRGRSIQVPPATAGAVSTPATTSFNRIGRDRASDSPLFGSAGVQPERRMDRVEADKGRAEQHQPHEPRQPSGSTAPSGSSAAPGPMHSHLSTPRALRVTLSLVPRSPGRLRPAPSRLRAARPDPEQASRPVLSGGAIPRPTAGGTSRKPIGESGSLRSGKASHRLDHRTDGGRVLPAES